MPSQQGIERARRLLRGQPEEDEGFLGGLRSRAEGLLSAGEQVGELGVLAARAPLQRAQVTARGMQDIQSEVFSRLPEGVQGLVGQTGQMRAPYMAERLARSAEGALPETRPGLEQTVAGKTAHTLGDVGSQVATAAVLGLPGALAVGALSEGQMVKEDILRRLPDPESKDARQKAWTGFAIGAGVSLADAIPLGKILGKLDTVSRGRVGTLLRLIDRVPAGVTGGVTEFAQSGLENMGVEYLTGDDIDTLREALEEGVYGGVASQVVHFLIGGRGRQSRPEADTATREGFLGPEGPAQELQAGRVGPRGEFIPFTSPPSEPISSEVSDLSAGRPKRTYSEPKRKDRAFLVGKITLIRHRLAR
jgi:hypothetical protein